MELEQLAKLPLAGLSIGELIMVGLIIAVLLEPLKKIPKIVDLSLLPIIAMIIGIGVVWVLLGDAGTARKDLIFTGIAVGMFGVGGRETVLSQYKAWKNSATGPNAPPA